MKKLVAIAALSLTAFGANATTYIITSSSTLNDVRKIGGRNIPEINSYTPHGGLLDPTDPASWPLMDADITTFPDAGVELNNINVSGTIDITGGVVTAAIINQLDPLSFGTYQSGTATNNLVTGDPGVTGALGPLNALVWTYDAVNSRLNHQSGGGTAATSSNVAACVPVLGVTVTGQCNQLQGAVNANGALGGTTISNSLWNWNGVAANYTVGDTATTPWHTLTNLTLNVGGASGKAGVIWDLTGFTAGVGGVITARTTADVLTGTSATAISGLYTLNVQVVPVPAAVWFFGSALGLLGFARRRRLAS